MAYIVMVYIVMAYIVMTYIVTASIVMTTRPGAIRADMDLAAAEIAGIRCHNIQPWLI